jgi:predicted transcriptional regulator
VTPTNAKPQDSQLLDALTGGAFSAHTSGERLARIREWLASSPDQDQLQTVFKELSTKDKGAAKLLRERLDEIKRSRGQEAIAQEWADRAQQLLATPKLNIADAMAWQRDAAKAGAPLSREPLSLIKVQLAERVKGIEDLQHRVQVQREAAVLLAQRIEVLSTKAWRDAQAVMDTLASDVEHWQSQAEGLMGDANWPSVDMRFPPLLEASRGQLLVVWEAFRAAVAQAVAAAGDASAPLPPVPVWADELRLARGVPAQEAVKPAKPRIDPELRAQAGASVREVLVRLEQEIAEGHGRASADAANALRSALKEFGRLIDDRLESQAHAALAAAGELEGWQRWRADQLREQLVVKAEDLLKRPEGQAIGGRKMQENLRRLREEWKQTDQGGIPNHALWKRFDDACNEAHKVVELWLEKVKAESALARAQRLALIEEVKTWAAANTQALDGDWKGFNRILYQFGDRWRDGGHVGEKVFAELQGQWKAAINAAAAPLEAEQARSLALRQSMMDEARALAEAPMLRIDAVRALQVRWQQEAQRVPMDRRQEQKLWDAFRKPLDEAFNRKTAERERADAALGERDRMVLEASRALQAANASGDAQAIRSGMSALEAALRGQAQAQAAVQALAPDQGLSVTSPSPSALPAAEIAPEAVAMPENLADTQQPSVPAAPAPKAPARPVVAVRGDDRPGMKRAEPAAPARAGRFGERKDGPRPERRDHRDTSAPARVEAPRLGDAAFRAQRDALESAQSALRKLAVQAHGEALTQLLAAWEKRSVTELPALPALGGRVAAGVRSLWAKALEQAPRTDGSAALLRLEMAAELPTPAEHLEARRALQLQLLTRRHDPAPLQTWGQDVATLLSTDYDAGQARRLQNILRVLLRA